MNHADDEARPPAIGPYGLIVMAEVLEHIHMPPSVVIGWIASLLTPGGHLLIQTPNAVSLPNRLRMLVGNQRLERVVPKTLRAGITIVYRAAPATPSRRVPL